MVRLCLCLCLSLHSSMINLWVSSPVNLWFWLIWYWLEHWMRWMYLFHLCASTNLYRYRQLLPYMICNDTAATWPEVIDSGVSISSITKSDAVQSATFQFRLNLKLKYRKNDQSSINGWVVKPNRIAHIDILNELIGSFLSQFEARNEIDCHRIMWYYGLMIY